MQEAAASEFESNRDILLHEQDVDPEIANLHQGLGEHVDHARRLASRINPDIVWNIEKGQSLTAAEIIRAKRDRHALFHRVARFFDDHDLLVCPTVAVPPFPVEQRFPTEIAGERLATYIDWMFLTFVITLLGCPAISLPCGLTSEGLPVGIQLVGRPHGDAELLGFAQQFEQALAFRRQVMPV